MTDLTEFVPELKDATIRNNLIVEQEEHVIKQGCTFEEARSTAIHCRATHPNESVGWYKCDNNTYTVFGVNI